MQRLRLQLHIPRVLVDHHTGPVVVLPGAGVLPEVGELILQPYLEVECSGVVPLLEEEV